LSSVRATSDIPADDTGIVVHVTPHPDDDALGAPVTLLQLADFGWRVINLVISLGRVEDQDRRRSEEEAAALIAGFELRFLNPPARISAKDDHLRAQRYVTGYLSEVLATDEPRLLIAPSPHDGHHGHEVVGRAVKDAVKQADNPPAWWMWGLWADLPFPTIYVPYSDPDRVRAQSLLDAYTGELERNDYRRLAVGRAIANATLGAERVFGFGSLAQSPEPYAELLCEVIFSDGKWKLGRPQIFDPVRPLQTPTTEDLSWWLQSPSPRSVRSAQAKL
jgi:LmbE family N-acetylglucosaminyl deacetylase